MIVQDKHLELFPMLNLLTSEQKVFLSQKMNYKICNRYDFIYMSDEKAKDLFFLLDGTIKIGMHSNDGKEIIKHIVHPGTIFGEFGLIGQTKRMDFAQAMNESVQYLSISVEDFQLLLSQNTQMGLSVIGLIGKKLQKAERKLESLIFKDARARIVEFIKDNALRRGRKVGFEMLFKHALTQQDIANITGTSRQTVTSVMNALKKDNLIYFTRNSILIRDIINLA